MHNDVADVHTDAEFNAAVRRHTFVPVTHAPLHLRGAGDRVHNAGKFYQHSVTRKLNNSPLMLTDFGINEVTPQRFEGGDRAGLVRAHQSAVTDDVSGKNSGEAAFHYP